MPMHPAIPLAAQYLSEHTGSMVQLLQHHRELGHGLRLAGLLQEVISDASEITEKQIEAILGLTRQTHEVLAKNLDHYEAEQQKFNAQYFATTDPMLRLEITAHIANIDDQMKSVRRAMEALHRFSAEIITLCGQDGLKFVQDLSVPYTEPRRIN